jgi:hypothetical protein
MRILGSGLNIPRHNFVNNVSFPLFLPTYMKPSTFILYRKLWWSKSVNDICGYEVAILITVISGITFDLISICYVCIISYQFTVFCQILFKLKDRMYCVFKLCHLLICCIFYALIRCTEFIKRHTNGLSFYKCNFIV